MKPSREMLNDTMLGSQIDASRSSSVKVAAAVSALNAVIVLPEMASRYASSWQASSIAASHAARSRPGSSQQ